MGIPRFASWISKKYPNMVLKALPPVVEGLYIDMNGIIHPCCHDEDDPSRAAAPEAEKIERVCLAVAELVEATRPTRVLHLAMDGVAPRAKMNQQRSRRYTAAAERYGGADGAGGAGADDEGGMSGGGGGGGMAPRERSFTEEEQLLAEQALKEARETLDLGVYGEPMPEDQFVATPVAAAGATASGDENPFSGMFPSKSDIAELAPAASTGAPHFAATGGAKPFSAAEFDSNCISPGTEFMDRCSERLREFVRAKVNSDDPLWRGLMVVWSDTQVPGEGEHKIIDFLRTQGSYPGWLKGGAHVIVGLDADLILLCLSLHLPNIYIMRDAKRTAGTFKASPRDVAGVVPEEEEREASQRASPVSSPVGEKVPQFVDASAAIAAAQQQAKAADSAAAQSMPGRRSKFEYYSISEVATSICTEVHTLAASLGIHSVRKTADAAGSGSGSGGGGGKAGKGGERGKRGGGGGGNSGASAVSTTRGGVSAVLEIGTAAVIDDFIVMATMMGNDFMPRLPSAFCGNMAMDNFIEVYVRAVLPFGSLATNGDVKLDQLARFLRGYAMFESMFFRKHMASTDVITYAQAACPLDDPVDESYRSLYYSTTSIRTKADIEQAARKYVEGLRFVWRYYSTTSQQCSWTWFYPFHHAPFAIDIAKFVEAQTKPLPPPPLENEAPSPFVQLLCILPPTSCKLLPAPFRSLMLHPPPDLQDTFCRKWTVDFAAANGKSHLSTVMLPFADLRRLTEECAKIQASAPMSGEELRRGTNAPRHDVFVNRSVASLAPPAAATATAAPAKSPQTAHGQTDPLVLHGDVAATAEPGHFTLADTAPIVHGSRPSYSVTTFVRNLPYIPGLPLKLQPQREPPATTKRGNKSNRKARSQENNEERDRGMNVGDFIICVACSVAGYLLFSWLFAGNWRELPSLLGDLVTVFAVASAALVTTLLIGFGVHNPRTGSTIVRNTIRDAYVDWLCASCLSMNFSRNETCFQCARPFVEASSWAVFSGKLPQSPPLMDPNHRAYCHDVKLSIPSEVYALEGKSATTSPALVAKRGDVTPENVEMM